MFKFFQKAGPSVAVASVTAALAVTNELLLQREERAYREKGLVTHRVWKTTNGMSAYPTVEAVNSSPSVSP